MNRVIFPYNKLVSQCHALINVKQRLSSCSSSTESEIEYHLIRDADWSIQIFS